MAEQRRKLIQALTLVVHGIDHLEQLVPTLAELGRRHRQYGIEDVHYDTVGTALLWTLEQGLGSAWTPQAQAAWSGAYAVVANIMRGISISSGRLKARGLSQYCPGFRLDKHNARAYFPRPREHSRSRTNMSLVMNHGYDIRVQHSNGFAPIDGGSMAHGNDLA
jgi:hypothetical protein